ncbi:MAG TPA: hypothetical protein VJB57_04045 [Dehalococcoidia bacterium]|nr:hypothetical protein [Dehalococcoidia bacterium]
MILELHPAIIRQEQITFDHIGPVDVQLLDLREYTREHPEHADCIARRRRRRSETHLRPSRPYLVTATGRRRPCPRCGLVNGAAPVFSADTFADRARALRHFDRIYREWAGLRAHIDYERRAREWLSDALEVSDD